MDAWQIMASAWFLLLVLIGALGILLVSWLYAYGRRLDEIQRHLRQISEDLRK
jgi:hypothetical protein